MCVCAAYAFLHPDDFPVFASLYIVSSLSFFFLLSQYNLHFFRDDSQQCWGVSLSDSVWISRMWIAVLPC